MQLYWTSTHFQLFITDFAKIISYLSGSRNSQFQGTSLNDCFRNSLSSSVIKIWKWLQNVSVEQCGGMLLEKVIRKNYKIFWHETSMRKPFFSKSTCSSTKKEFLHILFPWKFHNFTKNVQKKKTKTFRKFFNRTCFDEYFYRYVLKVDKTYLQVSFETIFFKMLWADT